MVTMDYPQCNLKKHCSASSKWVVNFGLYYVEHASFTFITTVLTQFWNVFV